MFKVLIAEDSKPIARYIRQLLEKSQLPLQVVHVAYNGEEALEVMRNRHVDILLTDIRMPKLDGLALIEQLKPDYPNLKVILISSYSDFEYTRKAINLHVDDYLLKPVEQPQLEEVMQRIVGQLQEMEVSRQTVLGELVEERWQEKLRLGPEFYEQPKLAMLLRRQPFTPAGGWQYETLQPIVAEACSPYTNWLLPLRHRDRWLVLASVLLKDRFASASAWMNDIHGRMRDHGWTTSAACLFEPIYPDRIVAYYRDLDACLQRELKLEIPVLKELDQASLANRVTGTSGVSGRADESAEGYLEMIRQRQKELYMLKLSEQLEQMRVRNAAWAELEALLLTIERGFQEAWQEVSTETSGAEADRTPQTPLIERFNLQDYDSFCTDLLSWSEEQFQQLQALSRRSSDELFEQMDQYIRQQLSGQLSITDLALRYHVSPSYVSRIMKRYTGQTFVQYYTKLKIEEACRLLRANPGLKVKDLSDALGFSDQHYFSRVFKDYTGQSPTEYKDQ